MENSLSSKTSNYIISLGFIIFAAFGIVGSNISAGNLQNLLYEISSIGLIASCALMTLRLFRSNFDFLAAGFLLLGIAEAVMSSGTALGNLTGQAEFGAGMALYVPALLMISIPAVLWLWLRIIGVLASIPFAIAAVKIFWGHLIPSNSPLPGFGYGLLTFAIIGWIISILRNKI